MKTYIAWLNGTSVARGTEQEVRDKAIAIFNSDSWQQWGARTGRPTYLRITRGARQTEVSLEELPAMSDPQDNQSVKGDTR